MGPVVQATPLEAFESGIDARLSSWPNLASNGMRMAVVGAGPLGLSCACFLAQCGYEVVVYEQSSQVGGMLAEAGPDGSVQERIEGIVHSAVEDGRIQIECGHRVDSAELAELAVWYDAVYIATGTSLGRFGLEGQGFLLGDDVLVQAGDFPNVFVNASRLSNPSEVADALEAGEAVALEIDRAYRSFA